MPEGALGTRKLFTQQFWWGSGIGLRGHWQHNLLFACSLSDCPRRVSSQELRQRHTEKGGKEGEEETEGQRGSLVLPFIEWRTEG